MSRLCKTILFSIALLTLTATCQAGFEWETFDHPDGNIRYTVIKIISKDKKCIVAMLADPEMNGHILTYKDNDGEIWAVRPSENERKKITQ